MPKRKAKRKNTRQQVFIEEYLACWNATRAAKLAGYSEKTAYSQGQRLLKNVEVARAIQSRLKEKAMSADEVLLRLTQHAQGSLEEGLTEDGAIDIAKMREAGKLHLVKSCTVTKHYFKGELSEEKIHVELHDAQAALNLLGKHHALFTDRTRVDDWRSEAVELIRGGKVAYDALAGEFGSDLATELFKQAGVPVAR